MSREQKTLKIAFIGGGLNSAVGKVHRTAVEIDNKYELVGGMFSRDAEISRRSAIHYGLGERGSYSSIERLLGETSPDVVAILTPTPAHYDCLMWLADTGLPIICEKPLLTDLDELAMVNQEFSSQHQIFVTYNYTGYPMVREARDLIRSGDLGKPIQIVLEMPQDGLIRPPRINGVAKQPQKWRLSDGVIPNVCLDLASHLIQMARFLTAEEFKKASANFANYSRFQGILDTAFFSGFMTNGASFSMWLTKSAHGCRNGLNFRVFCEKGSISWAQSEPELLKVGNSDGSQSLIDRSCSNYEGFEPRYDRFKVGHPAGYIEAFANHYSDIRDSILMPKMKNAFIFDRGDVDEELQMLEGLSRRGSYDRDSERGSVCIFPATKGFRDSANRLGQTNRGRRLPRLVRDY